MAPVLDIGAADLAFRTVEQPWIEREVFAPLRRRHIPVAFADVKDGPGVDIVADLTTAEGACRLRAAGAGLVLCCNVLEHVPDAADFARRLAGLVEPGGRLVVTVPHRYPHHRDPIDTMFRPERRRTGCSVSGLRHGEGRHRPHWLLPRRVPATASDALLPPSVPLAGAVSGLAGVASFGRQAAISGAALRGCLRLSGEAVNICQIMGGDDDGGLETHFVDVVNGLAALGDSLTAIAHERYAPVSATRCASCRWR